ncbi:MAG: hypothetical protein V1734_04000 [Nanoarchaeota archaeon]
MKYNILMMDLENTKGLIFRVEDSKGNILINAGFFSPEIKELYNLAAYAMTVNYFSNAAIVSNAANAPRYREMTKNERKGLEDFLAYESKWDDKRWRR